MTSENERIRRIEQELLPDPVLAELAERDAAYLTGLAHGRAGNIIDDDLFLDLEHGERYRRGLQVGRTAAVDLELIGLFGDGSTLRTLYGPDRVAGWLITEYTTDGRISTLSGQLAAEPGPAGDETDVQAATLNVARLLAIRHVPDLPEIVHWRVELTTGSGVTARACYDRERGDLVDGDHAHP